VAPVQVIVVPIWRKDDDLPRIEESVTRIRERLASVARVRVDWRDDRTPGYKFNDWELKGVPLRLEVGPRDVAADQVVLVRRDTREKQIVPLANLTPTVASMLAAIQANLFATANRMLAGHTVEVTSYDDLAARVAANAGWSLAHWCGDPNCEARVKTDTKATIRCIPRDLPPAPGRCLVCGTTSDRRVIFARAY
jgi:prolyl-tRNA synthetase